MCWFSSAKSRQFVAWNKHAVLVLQFMVLDFIFGCCCCCSCAVNVVICLFVWVLWYKTHCRLFNTKSIWILMLYSHVINMHIYTYTCRIHIGTIIMTQWRQVTQSFRKIYLSLYLKVLRVRGIWRPNRTATYWPPLLWPSASLSCPPGLLNRWPGGPLCWVQASSTAIDTNGSGLQTNWLPVFTELYNSSIAHSISLEWHVWSSSSGNNCHAVHRSLSSGASVYDCIVGFFLVPYCQPDSPTSTVFGMLCLALLINASIPKIQFNMRTQFKLFSLVK